MKWLCDAIRSPKRFPDKLFLSAIVPVISALFISCNPDATDPEPHYGIFSKTESGTIVRQNLALLSVNNTNGGLIIYADNLPDTVDYYFTKNISAEARHVAEPFFDGILLKHSASDDTLNIYTEVPTTNAPITFFGHIQINTPHDTPCHIATVRDGLHVYYMTRMVEILDARSEVNVMKHSGSCRIVTSRGDVNIEIDPPDNGICHCITGSGNIKLIIPKNISAMVFAETKYGSVTANSLSFTEISRTAGKITGKLGSGNIEIHLETAKGNIDIYGN